MADKYYAILRKGENGPYVDTATVSPLLEETKMRAQFTDTKHKVVAATMPVVGHTVLTEDEAERVLYDDWRK